MKVFAAVAASFLLCATASFAQINIQGEDGSTVTIGPGGININGRGPGSKANVKLGPGGIQIDSNDGYRRSRVNLGAGAKVQTNHARTTKTVTTTTKRVGGTVVKATTVNTATRNIKPSGPSAEEQVTIIETKIYGQSYSGKPLMARVEKLEIDNLGQKGSGPLTIRISTLAKQLGVTASGASTTIVNTGNSTVEINSPAPEALTVDVREGIAPHNSIAIGPALSNMVINENDQTIKGHCNGNSIVLNGNNCLLHLSGKLGLVTINGNNNRIKSESIGLVVANGNSNNVTWSHPHGAPQISNNGKDNSMHAQ